MCGRTSGLYCGPRTLASERPDGAGAHRRESKLPPALRQGRLAGRRQWRRRWRQAARNPDPVVLRIPTVTVELPASLRIGDHRSRRSAGRTSRWNRGPRQVGARRDPDPVVRRAPAVTEELPASLLVHDAIGLARHRGRGSRRRRARAHHHGTATRRRRHDRRRALLALDFSGLLAMPIAAAQRCHEQRRRQRHCRHRLREPVHFLSPPRSRSTSLVSFVCQIQPPSDAAISGVVSAITVIGFASLLFIPCSPSRSFLRSASKSFPLRSESASSVPRNRSQAETAKTPDCDDLAFVAAPSSNERGRKYTDVLARSLAFVRRTRRLRATIRLTIGHREASMLAIWVT